MFIIITAVCGSLSYICDGDMVMVTLVTICARSDLMGSEIWRLGETGRAVRYLVCSHLSHPHHSSSQVGNPGMEWAKLYKDNHNLFVILQHTTELDQGCL